MEEVEFLVGGQGEGFDFEEEGVEGAEGIAEGWGGEVEVGGVEEALGFGEVVVDVDEVEADGGGAGGQEGGEGGEGGVDAVEEGLLGGGRGGEEGGAGLDGLGPGWLLGVRGAGGGVEAGAHEGVGRVGLAGGCEADVGADLRGLEGEGFAGELGVGEAVHAEGGFGRAAGEGDGGGVAFVDGDGGDGFGVGDLAGDVVFEAGGDGFAGGVVEHAVGADAGEGDAGVDLERGPGGEAHLGVEGGVAGGEEDLLVDLAGDLMVAVAVGGAADEDGGEDERAVEADGADGVVEDAFVGPLGEGFFPGFGEAEVDDGAEELVGAGVAVFAEELLGANEAEGVVEVGGHEVLAAFAAVEGEHGDAGAEAAGLEGEEAAVFVVGVGDDEHHGGAGAELEEELLEGGGAVIDGEGVGGGLGH